jgi:hypothetical protein
MKTTILALGMLLFVPALRTQEHAPTVDVCRADRAVWYGTTDDRFDYLQQARKQFNNEVENNTSQFAKLPLREVSLRMYEMGICEAVDAENRMLYASANDFYRGIEADRDFRFIKRHNLGTQLIAEDDDDIR